MISNIKTFKQFLNENIKTFVINDELLKIASQETKSLPNSISSAINSDVRGLIVGIPRALDRKINKNDFTLDDVKKEYSKTLHFMKKEYGNKVILHRAQSDNIKVPKGSLTVLFADKKWAKRYSDEEKKLAAYIVPMEKIIGVVAFANGYYEIIVELPESGFFPKTLSENKWK